LLDRVITIPVALHVRLREVEADGDYDHLQRLYPKYYSRSVGCLFSLSTPLARAPAD
jgi:hypothetical protein